MSKNDNEIIAEFMGRPWSPVQAGYERKSSFTSINIDFKTRAECLEYCDEINIGKDPSLCFYPMPKPVGMDFSLHYHESWDWLMPVVEKIESTHILEGDDTYGMTIQPGYVNVFEDNANNAPVIEQQFSGPKIDLVYSVVLDFIRKYNENKQP
jgi:hypothetical protein